MATLLMPEDYQSPDDPAVVLADQREARIKRAIKEGLAAITAALVALPPNTWLSVVLIFAAIRSNAVRDALTEAYKPIADTFVDAAENASASNLGSVVVYDPLLATGQLADARKAFIQSIENQAIRVIRSEVLSAARSGLATQDIAEELQWVVGLTEQQAAAVRNFRSLLETNNRGALLRALRDRRFDATIRAAIENDASMSTAQVNAMVKRYAERMLTYRAETIAKTEAMNATTSGIRNAYVQAVMSGRLRNSEVKRFWQLVPDERLCPVCASVPRLNPNGVGVTEPYQSSAGPLYTVGVHPRCRCSEKYVADISRLTQQPFAQAA